MATALLILIIIAALYYWRPSWFEPAAQVIDKAVGMVKGMMGEGYVQPFPTPDDYLGVRNPLCSKHVPVPADGGMPVNQADALGITYFDMRGGAPKC